MEKEILSDKIINIITSKFSLRDKTFLTFIRQSGLKPNTIKQLQIKHVEKIRNPNPPIPCKIEIPQEIEKNNFGRHVSFIGEETVDYLTKYLKQREFSREKLTPNSLLFTIHNKPNKQILTKELNRNLKNASQKVKGQKIELDDLRNLFFEKTKDADRNHIKYLMGEPIKKYTPEKDDFYRKLYKELLMETLEIEPLATTYRIRKETQELKERLEEIESVLFPKTRKIADPKAELQKINKYFQKHPERIEQEENWYNQQVEEAKAIERLMKEDPWQYACVIQQMNAKIKTLESYLRAKPDKS